MKKDLIVAGLLSLGLIILAIVGSYADTGLEAATRIERGSYIAARSVNVSTNTGTALFSASVKRPDGICFNNSSATVWIGTNTNTANGYLHENVSGGFPVPSSGTFKLDGSMSGGAAATADPSTGSGTQNIRCIDGLVQ